MIRFLYPSDPLKPRRVDEAWAEEMTALQEAGFATSVLPVDDLDAEGCPVTPAIQAGESILYRGWMLDAEKYGALMTLCETAQAAAVTSRFHYLCCHHIANWYSTIDDLSPETVFGTLDELKAKVSELKWDAYFVKDYVKSLKTGRGSVVTSVEELVATVEAMQKFRGRIEGGLCLRRVEPFIRETEVRYFVFKGRAFAPSGEIPEIVDAVTERVACPFYSIDVVQREDGVARIVEIGDGQVSDLVGWTPSRFAQVFKS